MPGVTAETFELSHFDALDRGVRVAKEAFAKLEERVNALTNDNDRLYEEVATLAKRPTVQEFERLTAMVQDVQRGLVEPQELFAYVKACC